MRQASEGQSDSGLLPQRSFTKRTRLLPMAKGRLLHRVCAGRLSSRYRFIRCLDWVNSIMKRWLLLIIGPSGGVLLATVLTGELLVLKVAIRAFLFELVSLRGRGNRWFIPSVPERSWRTPSSACRPPLVVSDRNPLHAIARHAPPSAIVARRRQLPACFHIGQFPYTSLDSWLMTLRKKQQSSQMNLKYSHRQNFIRQRLKRERNWTYAEAPEVWTANMVLCDHREI
jgi:hypothetical protein